MTPSGLRRIQVLALRGKVPVGGSKILDVPDAFDGEEGRMHVAEVLVLGERDLVRRLPADV